MLRLLILLSFIYFLTGEEPDLAKTKIQ